MKRRLLNLLTALSLLVFVAVCVLWLRSYRVWDQLSSHWPTGDVTEGGFFCVRRVEAISARGRSLVIYYREGASVNARDLLSYGAYPNDPDDPRVEPSQGLFSARPLIPGIWVGNEPLVFWVLINDAWLAGAAAVLPAARLVRFVRSRRLRRAGLCPRCGYDLTGNVSGVCPECGTPSSSRAMTS
jgi:hypothetical protein